MIFYNGNKILREQYEEDESFVQKLYEEYKKYNGSSEAEIYQSEERKLKL